MICRSCLTFSPAWLLLGGGGRVGWAFGEQRKSGSPRCGSPCTCTGAEWGGRKPAKWDLCGRAYPGTQPITYSELIPNNPRDMTENQQGNVGFFFFLPKVISTPSVGLERITWRSRAVCSTDSASQAFPGFVFQLIKFGRRCLSLTCINSGVG